MRSAQNVCPSAVQPQPNAVFDALSASVFTRTKILFMNGGNALNRVKGEHVPPDSEGRASMRNRSLAPVKMVPVRENRAPLCKWFTCKAAADSPSAGSCTLLSRPLPLSRLLSRTVGVWRCRLGGHQELRRRRPVGRGLWGTARMVVVVEAGVVAALVGDEDTGPSCRLGQHRGAQWLRRPLVE